MEPDLEVSRAAGVGRRHVPPWLIVASFLNPHDNPQFCSDPGTPGQSGVQDVVLTPVGRSAYASQETLLAALLSEQCQQKRLRPASGAVPGQPACSA